MYQDWNEPGWETTGRDFSGIALFGLGALCGAGLMFMLDPRGGGRRRALVKDKIVRGSKAMGWYADKRARDLANRAQGAWEERKAEGRDAAREIPDDVLIERVRAQIGHVVSHPGSIAVESQGGLVTLRGPVLRGELDKVRDKLEKIRGIRNFDIQLTEHDEPGSIPGLQGVSRDQRRWGT